MTHTRRSGGPWNATAGAASGASVRTAVFSRGAAAASRASAGEPAAACAGGRRTQHAVRAAVTSVVDSTAANRNSVTRPC